MLQPKRQNVMLAFDQDQELPTQFMMGHIPAQSVIASCTPNHVPSQACIQKLSSHAAMSCMSICRNGSQT